MGPRLNIWLALLFVVNFSACGGAQWSPPSQHAVEITSAPHNDQKESADQILPRLNSGSAFLPPSLAIWTNADLGYDISPEGNSDGMNVNAVSKGMIGAAVKYRRSHVLDSVTFADQSGSLAAAYAELPATGGTVIVPPGYSETMVSTLYVSKPNSGFVFLGEADIQMGTNQIIVPAGTTGVFFEGMIAHGGHNVDLGARFTYSGTSNAFQIGDPKVGTYELRWRNISVRLTGGRGATGMYLAGVVYFDMQSISVFGNDTPGTFGIVFDGTGPDFTGNGVITNPLISHLGTCMKGTGSLNNRMNAVVIIGGRFSSYVSQGIGLDLQWGYENYIYGTDFESNSTAVKLGANAVNTSADIRSEANTVDVQADEGSSHNTVRVRTPTNAVLIKSDNGIENHLSAALDGNFDKPLAAVGIFPGFGAAPACDSRVDHKGFSDQP
jgi:hypothetical protein